MKKIAIYIISFYQALVSPVLRLITGTQSACRYSVSCSEYTKRAIYQDGVFIGLKKGFLRLLTCHPFANIGQQKV
ncbi:MAG: membrane protein insertion efficiency factor YidD [Candidatus Levyibacteriota bacterium]